MTTIHFQPDPGLPTGIDPRGSSAPWRPYCPPALDARMGILGWAAAAYAFTVTLTSATDAWKVATYGAYGFGLCVLLATLFTGAACLNLSQWRSEIWLTVVMVLVMVASAANASFNAWPATFYYVQVYLLFWALILVCDSFSRFKGLVTGVFLGSLALAIASLVLGSDTIDHPGVRDTGIARQANAYGTALMAGVFASFLLVHMCSRPARWIIFGSWVILLAALARSGSRQAFVEAAAMVGIYAVLEWVLHLFTNPRNAVLGCMAVMFLGAVLFVHYGESALVQRLLGTQISQDARTQLYARSWELFQEHPWLGIGPAGMILYTSFVYTHSTYMELLATTGVWSFLAFAAMALVLLGRLLSVRRAYAQTPAMRRLFSAVLAVFAGLMVAGLFHLTHSSKIDTVLFAGIIGIAVAARRWVYHVVDWRADYQELV